MNTTLFKHDLTRDLIVAAALRRRRIRTLQKAGMLVAVVGCALFLALPRHTAPSSVVVAETNVPIEPGYEIIQSDAELLNLLAEFGPVLAKREDGKEILILTAANP